MFINYNKRCSLVTWLTLAILQTSWRQPKLTWHSGHRRTWTRYCPIFGPLPREDIEDQSKHRVWSDVLVWHWCTEQNRTEQNRTKQSRRQQNSTQHNTTRHDTTQHNTRCVNKLTEITESVSSINCPLK